jgi:hypothetical protein
MPEALRKIAARDRLSWDFSVGRFIGPPVPGYSYVTPLASPNDRLGIAQGSPEDA